MFRGTRVSVSLVAFIDCNQGIVVKPGVTSPEPAAKDSDVSVPIKTLRRFVFDSKPSCVLLKRSSALRRTRSVGRPTPHRPLLQGRSVDSRQFYRTGQASHLADLALRVCSRIPGTAFSKGGWQIAWGFEH